MHPCSLRAASPRFTARLRPLVIALAIAHPLSGWAQTEVTTDSKVNPLPLLRVTANPLASDSPSTPSSILTGDQLAYRQSASLGETLNGLPGVSSSYFGPFASRPIIRGMEGDRIRLMRNGVGALDASSLSEDHAVPQDPLGLDRIEVIRGPAALLYGGSAIGGVVNTIDGRIPRERLEGLSGQVQSDFSTANNERSAAAALDTGRNGFNLHVDGASRSSQDLRIPGDAVTRRYREANPDDDEHLDQHRRLANSEGRADSASIGTSYTWDHGYTGLSYSRYRANYGSVAEPAARLDMDQDYYQFDSEVRDLEGAFRSVRFQGSYTDYQHREIEDGEVGTTFKNRGFDSRIEVRHAPLGPLEGIVGAQVGHSRFSALGEEAFIPRSDTHSYALFALEQWQVDPRLELSFGGRLEHTRLSPSANGEERFENDDTRDFNTGSLSTGAVYQLTPIWSLAGNLSYTERAPTFYELYANGPHAATGTYEIGDPNASKEKAITTDLALRFDTGKHRGSIGVFYTHFDNYIGMTGTGAEEEGEEGALPVYAYGNTRARFYGVEAESDWQLYDGALGRFNLELGADYVNAEDERSHQPLPRISPLRLRTALGWQREQWEARLAVEHAAGQHRVPGDSGDDSFSTDGYTRVDSRIGYHFDYVGTQWLAYLEGNNLTNQTIRYSTSVLREIAPAPRRSLQVGVKMAF